MKAVIVIPARMGSTRFPGKPKAPIVGRSLMERVWRIAKAAELADEVLIATPDEELREFAAGFGAEAVITSGKGAGTDAVAEALEAKGGDYDVILNLQGDAVLTPPWVLDDLLRVMRDEPDAEMGTPVERLTGEPKRVFVERKKGGSTSGTMAVMDRKGYAMYFSKGLIPHEREPSDDIPLFHHIGLYAYRQDTLKRLQSLDEGYFEGIEKLEQLRALENGIGIRVVEVDYRGRTHASVDLPEDVGIVEEIIAKEGELPV